VSRLFASRLNLFLILTAVTTVLGIVTNYTFNENLEPTFAHEVYRHGPSWVVGSSVVWGMEIFWIHGKYGSWIRRLHFFSAIAVKSVITIVLAVFIAGVSNLIFDGTLELQFFIDAPFLRAMAIIFIILILLHTVLQIVRIIGGKTLINIVLGKYVRPVREDRIFMFLDMAGSTQLAERLGDVGVQAMITRFFFDITEPIVQHGGEIHRYVGDQVVVTWPLTSASANARAVECAFAIGDLTEKLAGDYQTMFGDKPAYRIGLHGGAVVISQIGDQKQEISYFGDTVNTAARIEQQCKEYGCTLLISADLLEHIELPHAYNCQVMGSTQLRGRQSETELYSISRA